jgi:hypothetical protein
MTSKRPLSPLVRPRASLGIAVLVPGYAEAPWIVEHTHVIHEPRKLPVVLSAEEVARLLDAAPGLKYTAALNAAYGAACAPPRWTELPKIRSHDSCPWT